MKTSVISFGICLLLSPALAHAQHKTTGRRTEVIQLASIPNKEIKASETR